MIGSGSPARVLRKTPDQSLKNDGFALPRTFVTTCGNVWRAATGCVISISVHGQLLSRRSRRSVFCARRAVGDLRRPWRLRVSSGLWEVMSCGIAVRRSCYALVCSLVALKMAPTQRAPGLAKLPRASASRMQLPEFLQPQFSPAGRHLLPLRERRLPARRRSEPRAA
jgi:hypothetical protein